MPLNGATLTTSDQQNWTLGNLAAMTSPVGIYQLTLTAAGSGITDLAGNPLTVGGSITWRTVPPIPGDFNLDGVVDNLDKAIWFANAFTGTTWAQGDANGDGVVNGLDRDILYANLGRSIFKEYSAPPPSPAPAPTPQPAPAPAPQPAPTPIPGPSAPVPVEQIRAHSGPEEWFRQARGRLWAQATQSASVKESPAAIAGPSSLPGQVAPHAASRRGKREKG